MPKVDQRLITENQTFFVIFSFNLRTDSNSMYLRFGLLHISEGGGGYATETYIKLSRKLFECV